MSIEKIKIERPEDQGDSGKNNGQTRREFLRNAGLFVLGVALLRSGFDKSLGEFTKKEEELNKERLKEIKVSPELAEMEEDNIKSMDEIVDFGDKSIELDAEDLTTALKNYYKDRYKGNPKLRGVLERAYFEMGTWIEEIEEIFEKENVPKEYAYLAIPESHWILKDSSPKGALGPYQFMPKTARWLGLKTGLFKGEDPNIDERIDPLKSARACARFLRFLYEMSGDWNLALSGYNGGFFYKYEKEMREKGEEISYENFVKWMENKVEKNRKEVIEMDHFNYSVKDGDDLGKISRSFKVEVGDICEENGIENENFIMSGSVLRIPLHSMDTKKVVFKKRISDLSQNLSYPAKFLAIKELIEEGFVQQQRRPIKIVEIYTVPEIKTVKHRVKSDDTLWNVSQKYSVSQEDIQRLNNMGSSTIVKDSQQLLIPVSKGASLKDIAEIYGVDLEIMRFCNPDIIHSNKILFVGTKVRIAELED